MQGWIPNIANIVSANRLLHTSVFILLMVTSREELYVHIGCYTYFRINLTRLLQVITTVAAIHIVTQTDT